jgi:hypothetical protein
MLTAPTGNNMQLAKALTPACSSPATPKNLQNHGQSSNRYVKPAQYSTSVLPTPCHSPKKLYKAFGLTRPKATGAVCVTQPHQLVIVENNPTNERPDMTEQLAEMTAAIAKAEIAMKAAAWQLEAQTADIAMLRKALFELAYVAEENGIYLSNLTKSTQDTIVAMRLGGFK